MFYFFISEDMKESECINKILQYLKKKKTFYLLINIYLLKTLQSLVSIHFFLCQLLSYKQAMKEYRRSVSWTILFNKRPRKRH